MDGPNEMMRLLSVLTDEFHEGRSVAKARNWFGEDDAIATAVWGEVRRQTEEQQWRESPPFVFEGELLDRRRGYLYRKIWVKVGGSFYVIMGQHEFEEVFREGPWWKAFEKYVREARHRVSTAFERIAQDRAAAEQAEREANNQLAAKWLEEHGDCRDQ